MGLARRHEVTKGLCFVALCLRASLTNFVSRRELYTTVRFYFL